MFYKNEFIMFHDIPESDLMTIHNFMTDNKNASLFTFVGEGRFGKIYKYKQYKIKVFKYPDEINDEGYVLDKLIDSPYYPKPYFGVHDKYIVTDYVEGLSLENTDKDSLTNKKYTFECLKKSIEFAFNNGYVPFDFGEHNVHIKSDGTPMVIDVGRYFPTSDLYDYVVEEYKQEFKELLEELKKEYFV